MAGCGGEKPAESPGKVGVPSETENKIRSALSDAKRPNARRNIAFGIADSGIDEARLRTAVAQARLDEVIASLPSGLDTIVGENGVRLSGGQRQRVAIARALYHDPPVLFFDEATAALDNQTEREVTEAIAHLRHAFGGEANQHGSRTIIAIAHRLSTVRRADLILVVEGGRIAETGRHEDLVAREGGVYAKLHALQTFDDAGRADVSEVAEGMRS